MNSTSAVAISIQAVSPLRTAAPFRRTVDRRKIYEILRAGQVRSSCLVEASPPPEARGDGAAISASGASAGEGVDGVTGGDIQRVPHRRHGRRVGKVEVDHLGRCHPGGD